ncbi:MAG: hypothetical protein IT435_10775 [Phycisphaerales bacterium]|nr:hypothetical protein [Phycisphaerales bacterium]
MNLFKPLHLPTDGATAPRLGCPPHTENIFETRDIQPACRVRNSRVYNKAAVTHIKSELARIEREEGRSHD